jgi:hypothetical protein
MTDGLREAVAAARAERDGLREKLAQRRARPQLQEALRALAAEKQVLAEQLSQARARLAALQELERQEGLQNDSLPRLRVAVATLERLLAQRRAGVEFGEGVLKEAFRRGWAEVQPLVPARVRGEVERYLRCGDVRYGFVEATCAKCEVPRLFGAAVPRAWLVSVVHDEESAGDFPCSWNRSCPESPTASGH